MTLFSTSFFFFVGKDGPRRGHLCHTDTFLVCSCFLCVCVRVVFFFFFFFFFLLNSKFSRRPQEHNEQLGHLDR